MAKYFRLFKSSLHPIHPSPNNCQINFSTLVSHSWPLSLTLEMLKPLLLLLSFGKKIHSVSGCHDWVLLGAPNFIMHSQYISLMDLTCGRIDRFFFLLPCHQITATLQIKQNVLSHWLPEFIVSWSHLLSQAHRLHFASFFLQQIMTINLVAKSACCLPLEGGWVFLPLAGFHGASPQL